MSTNPSHDVLREQIKLLRTKHHDAEIGEYEVTEELADYQVDAIMKVVAAHTEEKVREARIDELNNLPDCNIESKFHGSTNVVLVEDVIARIKALTNKGKGDSDENN